MSSVTNGEREKEGIGSGRGKSYVGEKDSSCCNGSPATIPLKNKILRRYIIRVGWCEITGKHFRWDRFEEI